jgi:hypothetical protein
MAGNGYTGSADTLSSQSQQPAPAPGAPGSALDQLFQQLMQQEANATYQAPTITQLRQQAMSSASGTYDPQIAALRNAANQAAANAGTSATAIGKLYQGLSSSYNADLGNTKQQFTAAKASEKSRLADHTAQIKNNYTGAMKELAATYASLGIQQAANDSTVGALAKDQAFNTNQADTSSNAEQQALGQQQTGMNNYWTTGKGTASLQGANSQADLYQQLQKFQQTQASSIAALEAQKSSAYQSALSQLQQQVATQAAAQQNSQFTHLLDLGRFKMDIGNYNLAQSKATNSTANIGNGLSGAANYLAQAAPGNGSQYMSLIQGMILSQNEVSDPKTGAAVPYQKVIADIAAKAQTQGLDPNIAGQAAYAYFGKY